MSARFESLMGRWDSFCFDAPVEAFIKRWRPMLCAYAVFYALSFDWRTYAAISPGIFQAPGLFGGILGFPALTTLRAAQAATCTAAFIALLNRAPGLSLLAAGCGLLYLDAISNGFGFINVRIHFIWFTFAMALASFSASLAFRLMELVMVLAYVQSVFAKIAVGGLDWALHGTTLQFALMRQGMPAGHWLAQYSPLCRAGSMATFALELGFILYYPFPRLRRPLLTAACSFHLMTWVFLGIDFSHLWVFTLPLIIMEIRHA